MGRVKFMNELLVVIVNELLTDGNCEQVVGRLWRSAIPGIPGIPGSRDSGILGTVLPCFSADFGLFFLCGKNELFFGYKEALI